MAVHLARLRLASGTGQTYLGTGDAIHSEASGTLGRYNLYAVQVSLVVALVSRSRTSHCVHPISECFARKDNA
jgi:hypothetical protein